MDLQQYVYLPIGQYREAGLTGSKATEAQKRK
jgi:hypothetical protein